jgi:hypothetical protein
VDCRVAECVTIPQLHRRMRGVMKFNDVKSDTLNLRVSPSFKLALKAAAEHDQRSMVNMLEVLVAHYCDSNHIAVPEDEQPSAQRSRDSLGRKSP